VIVGAGLAVAGVAGRPAGGAEVPNASGVPVVVDGSFDPV
jgi:hypothetical protein